MRVRLHQRGRKDYAILIAERMVFISFVTNAFKNFFVLFMLIKCFCVNFLLLSKCLWVFLFGIGTSNVERLGL